MIFLFPALVSGSLLILLWRSADLLGWQAGLFGVWFVIALVGQFFAPSTYVWLGGLLAQVALAIVLLLKDRIDSVL